MIEAKEVHELCTSLWSSFLHNAGHQALVEVAQQKAPAVMLVHDEPSAVLDMVTQWFRVQAERRAARDHWFTPEVVAAYLGDVARAVLV